MTLPSATFFLGLLFLTEDAAAILAGRSLGSLMFRSYRIAASCSAITPISIRPALHRICPSLVSLQHPVLIRTASFCLTSKLDFEVKKPQASIEYVPAECVRVWWMFFMVCELCPQDLPANALKILFLDFFLFEASSVWELKVRPWSTMTPRNFGSRE